MCIFTKCCRLPVKWADKLPDAKRFKLALDGEAVLDKETGLVWERNPDTTQQYNWNSAVVHCRQKTIGGRKGWRLPAIEELASLVEPNRSSPALPNGHPFNIVGGIQTFWAATLAPYNLRHFGGQPELPGVDGVAWVLILGSGSLDSENVHMEFPVWCVRGGFNSSV